MVYFQNAEVDMVVAIFSSKIASFNVNLNETQL